MGNALFLPLTQDYASKEVRVGHVISRIGQIPRVLDQAKSVLTDADPIFISTAVEENEGNVNLVDSVAADIPAGSPLKAQYDKVAPAAKKALADFTAWMQNDLAKRPTNGRDWRLGKEWYAQKFRYVMETSITPDQLLAEAEAELKRPAHRDAAARAAAVQADVSRPGRLQQPARGASARTRSSARCSTRSATSIPQRDQLIEAVKADLEGIKQFIRDKKIVALGQPRQPEGHSDAGVRARHLLGGGIPLRAAAGAQRRSAVLGDAHRSQDARGEGREQAARVQQLHPEVAHHSRSPAGTLRASRARRRRAAADASRAAQLCSAMEPTSKDGPSTSPTS